MLFPQNIYPCKLDFVVVSLKDFVVVSLSYDTVVVISLLVTVLESSDNSVVVVESTLKIQTTKKITKKALLQKFMAKVKVLKAFNVA